MPRGSKKILWLADANTAHSLRWAEALAGAGFEILVYSLAEPRTMREWESIAVRVETAKLEPDLTYASDGALKKLRYVGAVPQVLSLISKFRPDIIHAHYASSYGVLGSLVGFRPRVVSIWGADVYTTPFISPVHRMAIRQVLSRADKVLSTSHAMRVKARELVDRQDIDVVPFGIDVTRFKPAPEASRDSASMVIGTIKSLEPKYGIEYLLKAFARVKRNRPSADIRLMIVGDGTLRPRLEQLARDLSIADTTQFVGRTDYRDVHRFHQALDIAVYPSVDDSESFGVSVVESQSCGVPVLVSNVGGLPEVVEDCVTGLVLPAGNDEAFASALERLLDSGTLRRQLGTAGRLRAVSKYALDSCVDLLDRCYSAILKRH